MLAHVHPQLAQNAADRIHRRWNLSIHSLQERNGLRPRLYRGCQTIELYGSRVEGREQIQRAATAVFVLD
jgi:hypothetical protein